MKPIKALAIALATASALAGCAAPDEISYETRRGDYRALSACGYHRLSREYAGLRYEEFPSIARDEIHYDRRNEHVGFVGFSAASGRRTEVQYWGRNPRREPNWTVGRLRAQIAGCGGSRRRR